MIVEIMQDDEKVTAKLLAETVGISVRKIEENIAKLKKLAVIDRVGGTRGSWKVSWSIIPETNQKVRSEPATNPKLTKNLA